MATTPRIYSDLWNLPLSGTITHLPFIGELRSSKLASILIEPMALAFLFGSPGALMAEIIKRWDQLASLPEEKFSALLKEFQRLGSDFVLSPHGRIGRDIHVSTSNKCNLAVLVCFGSRYDAVYSKYRIRCRGASV
jgi:hypothetical protein